MKRFLFVPCVLCLLAGLLVGGILPMPWDAASGAGPRPFASSGSSSISAFSSTPAQIADDKDNFSLLRAACHVAHVLKAEDYTALAEMVHPERGVTFTPYSTVSDTDLTFTQEQIKALSNDTSLYAWGFTDGRGSLISMTMEQYFSAYVFAEDYTTAPQIGLNQVMMVGNALENVSEAYPDCRFVDFSFPSIDPDKQGMDWRSLKLVFQPEESGWYLVGVIHGEWTI